ncbi:DNA polymerase III subunit gamma/tau [Candidatus Saccharibacteria bacterium]|nr:DNA polymerase III subunit gamma/tau [Candidatus Saccharibacteria bacterium]
MSKKALYRKYRSTSLDEIVGQPHVTDILKKSLKQGNVAHAYLLTGPRGVGKTSIARILAHEINGLDYTDESTHLDIIEIDAASNNGVDDVRDLRDKAMIAPSSAAKKVYIIDEVHMLSKAAFNALLKILEEPPEHIVFILATTDVDKLPATIISRTQQFHFRLIPAAAIKDHLKFVADKESIAIDDEALELIADRAEGGFRDALSLLDQLSSLAGDGTTISKSMIEENLGLAHHDIVEKITDAYLSEDSQAALELLLSARDEGISASLLISQLLLHAQSLVRTKPAILSLIDALISAADSSYPQLKLLTVFALPTAPISQPPYTNNSDSLLQSSGTAPRSTTAAQSTTHAPTITKRTPVKKSSTTKQIKQDVPQPVNKPLANDDVPKTLDWEGVVNYAKANHVAIYSVLCKCDFSYSSPNLTIHAANAFYSRKLDDSKYRIMIAHSLASVGAGGVNVTITTEPKPPADAKLAAIAQLMGGGTEVSLNTLEEGA